MQTETAKAGGEIELVAAHANTALILLSIGLVFITAFIVMWIWERRPWNRIRPTI